MPDGLVIVLSILFILVGGILSGTVGATSRKLLLTFLFIMFLGVSGILWVCNAYSSNEATEYLGEWPITNVQSNNVVKQVAVTNSGQVIDVTNIFHVTVDVKHAKLKITQKAQWHKGLLFTCRQPQYQIVFYKEEVQ